MSEYDLNMDKADNLYDSNEDDINSEVNNFEVTCKESREVEEAVTMSDDSAD